MKRLFRWLDVNLEPILIAVLFIVMLSVISVQVILRMIFKSGFAWGEELSRYIFVWLSYFGISYATRNQRHIRISFVSSAFGVKVNKVLMLLSDVIFLALAVMVTKYSYSVVQGVAKFNDRAVTMNISLNILYASALIGFVLISLRLLQGLIWKLTHFKSPLEVFENADGVHYNSGKVFFDTDASQEVKKEVETE